MAEKIRMGTRHAEPGGMNVGTGEKSKNLKGAYHSFFRYLGKFKWSFYLAALLSIAGAVLNLIGPNKLSEVTCNLHFDQEVVIPEFIRLFRKAYIPHNFKEIRQKDSDDPLINDHIFVMKTAGVIVKAYDKIYELKKKGHCPKKLAKENILHIEVGLHRKEFLRKFKLSKDEAPYYILRLCYKNVIPEILSYLSKLFPSSGTHIPYKKAGKLIENNVADALLKAQMTFLLKAASDSDTLTAATHKLKKFYNQTHNYVNGKRLKRIFKEFNTIDVNPICLLESTRSKEIPSITNLMDDYFAKKKQHTK